MLDIERVKTLTSLLEKRSSLDIREALVRYYDHLSNDELESYDDEIGYLLKKYDVEVELPF